MRLVALTAAAALLGTGCFVSTTDPIPPPPGQVGDANVFWSFLRSAPASPGGFVEYDASLAAVNAQGICPESDVDTVRVTSAAGTRDVACTGPIPGGGYSQGITILDLPEGLNSVTLTGYRGGVAVYRSTTSVNVLANTTVDKVVPVQGISAALDLNADLRDFSTGLFYANCTEAGFPDITYQLFDSFGTLVEDGASACQNPLPVFAFTGFVDFDNYTVRLKGFEPVQGGRQIFDSCNQALDHFQTQTGVFGDNTFTLNANKSPFCP